jgi:hypothetical protein
MKSLVTLLWRIFLGAKNDSLNKGQTAAPVAGKNYILDSNFKVN